MPKNNWHFYGLVCCRQNFAQEKMDKCMKKGCRDKIWYTYLKTFFSCKKRDQNIVKDVNVLPKFMPINKLHLFCSPFTWAYTVANFFFISDISFVLQRFFCVVLLSSFHQISTRIDTLPQSCKITRKSLILPDFWSGEFWGDIFETVHCI